MQMMLKPQRWFSFMMKGPMGLRAFGLRNWENTKVNIKTVESKQSDKTKISSPV